MPRDATRSSDGRYWIRPNTADAASVLLLAPENQKGHTAFQDLLIEPAYAPVRTLSIIYGNPTTSWLSHVDQRPANMQVEELGNDSNDFVALERIVDSFISDIGQSQAVVSLDSITEMIDVGAVSQTRAEVRWLNEKLAGDTARGFFRLNPEKCSEETIASFRALFDRTARLRADGKWEIL